MPDFIDETVERVDKETALIVGDLCKRAAMIPKGEPGECFYCGEDFARVVEVMDPATYETVCSCGRCRDKRGLG